MDIDTLKEIIVLANKKSYSAAAEELYINQSSLSRHIQLAEERLGTQLFYRNSRLVQLTKAGEVLLPYAEEIVKLEKEYTVKLEEEKRLERIELRIGTVMGLSAFGLMSKIAGFLADNRDVSIQVLRFPGSVLKDKLKAGECDFIFVQETSDYFDDGFKRLNMVKDGLVVVLPLNHPLAGQKSINIEQLKDECWFFQRERELLTRLMFNIFKKNNFTPKIPELNGEGIGILELVENGLGISLELNAIAKDKNNKNISLVELEDSDTIFVNLAWKNLPLSPAAKKFLNYMKKQ